MTDLERLAAILTAPYRDLWGSLRCAQCTAPLELAPGRRQARPWGQGLPERPCRCRRKKAA